MKKCLFQKFVSFALAMLLVGSISTIPIVAASIDNHTTMFEDSSAITPRTEQTKIYYRTYNGNLQYRIWSVTYSKWLTDWTNC